ncbi:MAG: hypothetical protein KIS78_14865 [Labilithrix sp.]|nr:hypothetical protein [Labilithrix sp.]
MPRIDERSGDIIIRIVYDGMPEAGKTTNIHQLFASIPLQRRGDLASPDTTGRRTEFFDWLDFSGGFVDGRRVRCQVVSVPGQPQLLHRRTYLIETADVVVFVADSRKESVEQNRESVSDLVGLLHRFAPTLSAAVVVQANKQDLPGALRPRTLAAQLEVPLTAPVIPAVAHAGRGVLDTFILAARLATDRVRALVVGGTELSPLTEDQSSANALHVAMVALEDARSTIAPRRAVGHEAALALVRRRANDVETARACEIPRPEALLAGHVWPPVKGRAAVAAAMTGDLEVPDHAADWAPDAPIEIGLEGGWTLHSSARWTFPSESHARADLLAVVRRLLATPELVPEGRAMLIAPDSGAFRLWMLTPPLAPLAARLLEALVRRDVTATAAVLDDAARARTSLVAARGDARAPGGSSGVALQEQRVVVLAATDGGEPVDEHLAALARRVGEGDAEAALVMTKAEQLSGRWRGP